MEEKLTLLQRVRNLFRFKIKFTAPENARAEDTAEDGGSMDEIAEQEQAEDVANGGKAKKPKKKKKPKGKKANASAEEGDSEDGEDEPAKGKGKTTKKPKPKKEKKSKPKKPVKKEGEQGGKKKKLIIILIAVGVIVIAGGITAGVLIARANNTPEKRLEKAAVHIEKEEYDEAIGIYEKLISDELAVVEAYLGIAESHLAADNEEAAVAALETGYEQTSHPGIAAKLLELRPPEEDEEEEQSATPAATPVVWADEALGNMIRMALGKDEGATVTVGDLNSIRNLKILGETHAIVNETPMTQLKNYNSTEGYTIEGVLHWERGGIRSLADLAHFQNLTRLTVAYNSVEDISGIAGLTKLTSLGLHANEITDIKPLGRLTNLEELFIYNNHITDVSPLGPITNLRMLYVQHNQIADISVVAGFKNLEELFVTGNSISEISHIGELRNLRMFYAGHNRITDISVIEGMAAPRRITPVPADQVEEAVKDAFSLTDVHFIGNPVQDYGPARGIRNVNRTLR